ALIDPQVNSFPSYEVRIVGNIVRGIVPGSEVYIAGLVVPASQQGMNGQQGYINYIDYATGRFRVGGILNDPTTGTLCEINDPVGRYGYAHSPDQRFQADTNNPTISTSTGFPVGIPKVAPTAVPIPADEVGDPDRPYTNRPRNGSIYGTDPFLAQGEPLKAFTMPSVQNVTAGSPDPRRQIPLMVGDWVDFSGTTFKIKPRGSNRPVNQYVSVHTLTAHLGVKTIPGTLPAYVRVEEFLFGVGDGSGTGPTVQAGTPPTPIAQETSTRATLVAFTTDSDATQINNTCLSPPSPTLPGGALFAIAVDPVTGAETELQFPRGSTALSPADFCLDDPVRGRIRWTMSKNPKRPVAGQSNAVGTGKFYREYILRLTGTGRGTFQLPDQVGLNGAVLPGLVAGQYRLPIFDYIFGEGTNFGEPWPPFNFNDFGFLVNGSGVLNTGAANVTIGPLNPFPLFQ
ncbi:MAG: hypothetical protein ACLGPL_08200, partial [Acidobacteriota bacterium]